MRTFWATFYSEVNGKVMVLLKEIPTGRYHWLNVQFHPQATLTQAHEGAYLCKVFWVFFCINVSIWFCWTIAHACFDYLFKPLFCWFHMNVVAHVQILSRSWILAGWTFRFSKRAFVKLFCSSCSVLWLRTWNFDIARCYAPLFQAFPILMVC